MRAIVTGSRGFVGGHLSAALRAAGFEVLGVDRATDAPRPPADDVERVFGDVGDGVFMARTLAAFRPTHLFHLAWTFDAFPGAEATVDAHRAATAALFEAASQASSRPWIMLASSSAVYGSAGGQPIDEDFPLRPTTSYGTSKVAVEGIAVAHARKHGGVAVARTFNLLGPRVPQRLFPGSLTSQIVTAELGAAPVIRVGRLDSARDYLDVRDAVRAYVAMAGISPVEQPATFNVCSGVARSCLELAEAFIASARVPVRLEHDAARLQSGDVDSQRGSAMRLEAATGWRPGIALAVSVQDMLDVRRREAALDAPIFGGITPAIPRPGTVATP